MATHSRFLENPMDRGPWQAIAHGVTESDMTDWLSKHKDFKTWVLPNQQNYLYPERGVYNLLFETYRAIDLYTVGYYDCLLLLGNNHYNHKSGSSFGLYCCSVTKSCPAFAMMPSNHLILCHPLLLLPSIFASIRVFPIESTLHIDGLNIEASALVLINWSWLILLFQLELRLSCLPLACVQ